MNHPNIKFHCARMLLISMALCISFSLLACTKQTSPLTKTGFYFDTVIAISLYDSTDEALLDDCFALAKTYENRFSKTVEGSDIWNINHANAQPVEVHEDTIELLQTALYYAELFDGKIDPTIGSVSQLWNFNNPTEASIPSANQLQDALMHVNYQTVTIKGNSVRLEDPATELDLGFIAKGYIADQMKEYLVAHGVKSATINLGGNVLTIGSKPDGSPFRIGIQKPFADSGITALTLSVTDKSAVSSGNYERYFEKDGVCYHHILDTQTGYPVQNDLSSVTILSDSSVEGDALSTACFILGSKQGMAWIEKQPGIEAVFIKTDGSILYSSGLN